MNCIVWRVPRPWEYFEDSGWKYEFVRNELIASKILYQGWGIEDLRKGELPYIAEWIRIGWGDSVAASERFKILKPMLDIEVGNPIVIPKFSVRPNETKHGRYFTIVICKKVYDFSFPAKFSLPGNICQPDFGHFIEINPNRIATYDYDSNQDACVISAKFRSYSRAINRANDDFFKKAVKALMP